MKLTKLVTSAGRKSAMILTLMSAAAGMPLYSREVEVCLSGHKNLDADTMRVFGQELAAIARSSGTTLVMANPAGKCEGIRLHFKATSKTDVAALGTTVATKEGKAGEIEIYTTTIAKMVKSNLPAVVGKGMARVAAQEIGKCLKQPQSSAQAKPVTAPQLMVKDNQMFLFTAAALAMDSSPKIR